MQYNIFDKLKFVGGTISGKSWYYNEEEKKLHTHTHTHTHVWFLWLRGLSIGVMVFILNKLCVLLPYTYPTPNLALTGDCVHF